MLPSRGRDPPQLSVKSRCQYSSITFCLGTTGSTQLSSLQSQYYISWCFSLSWTNITQHGVSKTGALWTGLQLSERDRHLYAYMSIVIPMILHIFFQLHLVSLKIIYFFLQILSLLWTQNMWQRLRRVQAQDDKGGPTCINTNHKRSIIHGRREATFRDRQIWF